LQSENWLRLVARLSSRSYEEMRVAILEFLDTDVFHVSIENCVSFLDPLIESWDIDLATFGMDIVLNHRVAPGQRKRIEFVETEPEPAFDEEPGLREFLQDASLSGDATEEEIDFLRKLRFKGKRPAPLYYYRELQNLRDPLHFRTPWPNRSVVGTTKSRVQFNALAPGSEGDRESSPAHNANRIVPEEWPSMPESSPPRGGGPIDG